MRSTETPSPPPPPEWEEARATYLAFAKADQIARAAYRRTVDGAYDTLTKLRSTLRSAEELSALTGRYGELEAAVRNKSTEEATSILRAFERELRTVAESYAITSEVTKARRRLSRKDDKKGALRNLAKAAKLHQSEASWRTEAAALDTDLARYDEKIRNSIGLRKQQRLPYALATSIAACLATPRDISLSF